MFNFKTSLLPFCKIIFFILAVTATTTNSFAQNFVKVTDPNNPIVSDTLSGNYIGCSWIDINNDGKLDLFVNRKAVYENLGGGNFMKLQSALGMQSPNLGESWSDYNNDGNIDCFVIASGAANSFLYKNFGNGVFNKVTSGQIGDSTYNTGWGCAWADYDNDGYTDLFITAANNFGIVHHSNRLYHNNGDETFSRVEVHGLTDTLAPYTIATWSDYDQDGDMDLFIGTGPGGALAPDYLYKNMLVETGTANLVRLEIPPLSTDLHDGQVWNWIDYDNDGDLDAFVTNYSNVPNMLYRNNNGTYERMTAPMVGSIVSDPGPYLTNLWGDFDNDGDLDCFVTREVGSHSSYYNNNGDGTFTRIDSLAIVPQGNGNFGATAGDYDNNGTLDLYVAGVALGKGLFRNDLSNGNKWVNIKCIGGGPNAGLSNKSAIGSKVKAKATINGIPTWQYREIESQNSFNSMNMLNVHFGFGNATVIDSLIIIWPRGLREVFTNVAVNNFYKATENQGIVSAISHEENIRPDGYKLDQNFPNPFNPNTKINYQVPHSDFITLKIYDILGKEVATLVNGNQPAGYYEVTFDAEGLSSGTYFYNLSAGSSKSANLNFVETKRMTLLK